MAQEGIGIPFYVDVFEPLKKAAGDVPSAAKPLESQMDALSERLSKSILKMGKAAAKGAGSIEIGELDKKMARYANSARLAAQHMAELGEAQGIVSAGRVNISALYTDVTNLVNKWNSMRLGSKFDENGNIRNRAQDIIDKLSKATEKAIKFGDALANSAKDAVQPLQLQINLLDQYEKYMARLKEGKRVVEELRTSMKGLMAPNEQSMFVPFDPQKMDTILTALAHAQVQLNKPVNITPYVESLSRADFELLQMREHYRALEESSRRLSTSINGYRERLAELNEQWNRLTAEEKYTLGGKMTSEAREIYNTYKRETEELMRQGQTLDQIFQKEERLMAARKKGIQNRRYENAILNSNVKTMRVLQEQERILSDRLSRTEIGSGKYKQLKADLEAVRTEIEKVNGRVSESTIPSLDKANNHLANLVKRSIQLVALHSATTFIRNIREVTSEFEMQRVALGGIIQDTERANALFKEIKAAAVRSPFEIKDLVTYTKQLSAYRVETEDLFRITMQLADVSAGLGVDMNRLILAYGQVKSASVLRGQELRQFTEAGIPLVKLLADKFEELGRAGTTTADVFELISKRAVPFEMIAEIFDDMTQRGGMFYKMQEKQSETLLGQWNNLKDALSIMYDEMGNTPAVHNAMTSLINDARFIFQNWRLIAGAVKAAAVQFVAIKAASLWMPNLRRELTLAKRAQDAFTRSTELSKYAMETGSKAALKEAARLKTYSVLVKQAAVETRLFYRTWLLLKAAMSGGGWIGLAIGALTTLISVISSAVQESTRLKRELNKIGSEGETSINRSVSNFTRLAHAAVSAADGSKEQTEAIAELKRTYGDIIPAQHLEVNALRELQGSYESLTMAIREKISEQIREQKVSTIVDEYSKKIEKRQKKAGKLLEDRGLDKEQVRAVMDEVQKAVDSGLLSISTSVNDRVKIIKDIIESLTGIKISVGQGYFDENGEFYYEANEEIRRSLSDLVDVYYGLNSEIRSVDDSMKDSVGTYGKFAKMSKDMAEDISNIQIDTSEFGRKGTFKYNQENIRQRVEIYWDYIQKAFEEVNRERADKIDITGALLEGGKIDFDVLGKAVEEAMRLGQNTRLNTFIDSIQEGYEKLIPSDRIVNLVRAKVSEFANAFNVPMDTAQQYYKKADDSMEDYVKSLQESEESLNSSVNQMELNNKEIENGTKILRAYSQAEIDATKNAHLFVQALIEYFSQFKKKQDKDPKTAYVQDPFIKQLQDRMRFMKDFKRGYDDLRKYMSSSTALDKEAGVMLTRGLSLDIDASEQKRAAESLSKWYEDTYNAAFKYLQDKKGVTGTMTEFLSRQITGNTNRDKMLRDFQQLIQSLFDAKTDFDTSQIAKSIEESLKRVTEEIKRSETARNFYNEILGLTGDEELATTMSVSVYGGIGDDFKDRIQRQLVGALNSLDKDSFEGLSDKIKEAFNAGDYKYLVDNLGEVPEKLRDVVKKVAEDSEKYSENNIKTWLKELNAFKTYGEKRVQLAKQTAQRIADINASELPEGQKRDLVSEYQRKEAEEVAKLQYEAFKDTPMYIHLFENLDAASTRMLQNMKDNLVRLKDNWGDLDPQQLREMQRRVQELDEQLAERNPFRVLVDGIKAYREQTKEQSRAEIENNAIYDQEIANAQKRSLDTLTAEYESLKNNKNATEEQVEAAKQAMEAQSVVADEAQRTADESEHTAENLEAAARSILAGAEGLSKWVDVLGNVGNSMKGLMGEILSDEAASYFSEQFDNVLGGLSGAASAGIGIAKLIVNPTDIQAWVQAMSGVLDVFTSIFGVSNAAKIKKAEEDIRSQEHAIQELEFAYERLEKAMDSAFGSDFIENFNARIENMQARVDAYRAQAEAEESKGKKADQEKIRDYKQSARDLAAEISDMQEDLVKQFTGTDLGSAARDFASSWVEAYASFSSTTDALKGKFQEMIKNMVTESLAARIIETQLRPIFEMIDELSRQDSQLSVLDIAEIASRAQSAVSTLNLDLTNLMNALGAAGLNIRSMGTGLTGIAKDIQGASEESILGLAAGINTQNFYMSHIDMNVASILAVLTGEPVASGTGTAEGVPDPYKDQMLLYAAHIPAIDQNLADLLLEVRRVIKPRDAARSSSHVLVTNL